MKIQVLSLTLILSSSVLVGCGTGEPVPDSNSLVESFAQQVAAIGDVTGFEHEGDELSFYREDGAGDDIHWEVSIDSAVVEPNEDERLPFRGVVKSSWSAAGRSIVPSGNISGLPMWVLDAGVSQECWAFWEETMRRWDW